MLSQFQDENCLFKLVSEDPVELFRDWHQTASKSKEVTRVGAVQLATATKDGKPSLRTVSLGGFSEDGFRWNTNMLSRKGQQLENNPQASMLFVWDCPTEKIDKWDGYTRQVSVDGKVVKQSPEEALATFKTWPRTLQLQFSSCQQSSVVPSQKFILEKRAEVDKLDKGKDDLKPVDGWGGYILKPDRFEFWQQFYGEPTSERIIFRRAKEGESVDPQLAHRTEKGWIIERLAP